MKISWIDTVNQLCGNYFDHLAEDLDKAPLSDESRALVTEFLHDCDNNYHDDCDFESALRNYAAKHGIDNIAYLFDGELLKVATYLMGDDFAALLQRYMRIVAESPYTYGYSRRSMRCRSASVHINHSFVSTLKDFVKIKATGFSVAEILRGGRTPEEAKNIANDFSIAAWLSSMIDSGNRECIDYLKEAMTSENNANRMNRDHFLAIAKSANKELLELEGKLLLAAATGGAAPGHS